MFNYKKWAAIVALAIFGITTGQALMVTASGTMAIEELRQE